MPERTNKTKSLHEHATSEQSSCTVLAQTQSKQTRPDQREEERMSIDAEQSETWMNQVP